MTKSGDRVRMHNGPGNPLEWATLRRLESKAHALDLLGIEVWWIAYDSEPNRLQVRGFPCTCEVCI